MFVNKQDDHGRFGALGHLDDDFDMARISEADLRVLLSCTLYCQDLNILQGFCLFDKLGKTKGKQYRLDRKKDFQQFYLIIRVFRQNLATAEKFQK